MCLPRSRGKPLCSKAPPGLWPSGSCLVLLWSAHHPHLFSGGWLGSRGSSCGGLPVHASCCCGQLTIPTSLRRMAWLSGKLQWRASGSSLQRAAALEQHAQCAPNAGSIGGTWELAKKAQAAAPQARKWRSCVLTNLIPHGTQSLRKGHARAPKRDDIGVLGVHNSLLWSQGPFPEDS